jgi:Zn ribbon nucleic-acid-binding protein
MVKIRFCPKCKGTNIVAVAGMQIGIFKCVDCGFRSPIFPVKDLEDKLSLKKTSLIKENRRKMKKEKVKKKSKKEKGGKKK